MIDHFGIVDTGHCFTQPNVIGQFNFVDRKSSTLVVTVGDSWTWGADLTPDNDNQYRLAHVYGNLVSEQLGADWLNLGQSGSGNIWLCQRVEELAKILPTLHYQKIYVICTLTEIGRAINAHQHIDYYNFFQQSDATDLLLFLNRHVSIAIVDALASISNVEIVIGTNFVDPLGLEPVVDCVLTKSWLELCCEAENTPYTGTCFVVSPWVIEEIKTLLPLVPDSKQDKFLTWLNSLLDVATQRADLIKGLKCMKNYHPNAQGHCAWAEYLLTNIQSKLKIV